MSMANGVIATIAASMGISSAKFGIRLLLWAEGCDCGSTVTSGGERIESVFLRVMRRGLNCTMTIHSNTSIFSQHLALIGSVWGKVNCASINFHGKALSNSIVKR